MYTIYAYSFFVVAANSDSWYIVRMKKWLIRKNLTQLIKLRIWLHLQSTCHLKLIHIDRRDHYVVTNNGVDEVPSYSHFKCFITIHNNITIWGGGAEGGGTCPSMVTKLKYAPFHKLEVSPFCYWMCVMKTWPFAHLFKGFKKNVIKKCPFVKIFKTK